MNDKENVIHICKECSDDRKKQIQSDIENIITKCRKAYNLKNEVFFKVSFADDKMTEHKWVKVTKMDVDSFTGTLDNVPLKLKNYTVGDTTTRAFTEIEDYICT